MSTRSRTTSTVAALLKAEPNTEDHADTLGAATEDEGSGEDDKPVKRSVSDRETDGLQRSSSMRKIRVESLKGVRVMCYI
jgi:hypothetical protein